MSVEEAYEESVESRWPWRRANCPFCWERVGKVDRSHTWGINTETGYWHCYRCKAKGVLHDIAPDTERVEQAAPVVATTPEGFYPLTDGSTILDSYREFMVSRGVAPATWEGAGVGACIRGKYAGRVVIPVTRSSKWVGFIARTTLSATEIADRNKGRGRFHKYLLPPWRGRGSSLFNQDALMPPQDNTPPDHVCPPAATTTEPREDPILVVEGVFDALPHWPDVVACLGKPTQAQEELLLASRRPLVIALDGDAWREAWMLAHTLRLRGHERVTWVRLDPLTDPNDYTTAEIHARREEWL